LTSQEKPHVLSKYGLIRLATAFRYILVVQPVQEKLEANKQDILISLTENSKCKSYQVNNDGILPKLLSVNGDTYETVKMEIISALPPLPFYDLQGKSKVMVLRNAILTTNYDCSSNG